MPEMDFATVKFFDPKLFVKARYFRTKGIFLDFSKNCPLDIYEYKFKD